MLLLLDESLPHDLAFVMEHLRLLVPDILAALATVRPGTVSKVGPGVPG